MDRVRVKNNNRLNGRNRDIRLTETTPQREKGTKAADNGIEAQQSRQTWTSGSNANDERSHPGSGEHLQFYQVNLHFWL